MSDEKNLPVSEDKDLTLPAEENAAEAAETAEETPAW